MGASVGAPPGQLSCVHVGTVEHRPSGTGIRTAEAADHPGKQPAGRPRIPERLRSSRATRCWVAIRPAEKLMCHRPGMPVGDPTQVKRPGRAAAKRRLPWGYLAASWALLFALLHLFWALGGSWLLASSAGATLAEDRPTWFVIGGLWGVAVVLVVGAAIGVALARRLVGGRAGRLASMVSCVGGACLILRGVAVQVVLLTDAGGVASNVGEQQTRVSLVLWNPWFVLGGLFFAAAGTVEWRDLHAVASRHKTMRA